MKAKRKLLFMFLVLVIMFSPMLPWMQTTALAQETQTLTIEDKKLYDSLKSCFESYILDNRGAMVANDDETQTMTLDMQKIETLKISDADMTRENSRDILQTLFRNCTNLRSFHLNGSDLSGVDFSSLSQRESLKRLFLVDCKLSEVPDITLPNLQKICLAENDLSADGACNHLTKERFPALTDLWLDECRISDISFIENMGNLETLYLGDNMLTDDSLAVLIDLSSKNLSGLKELNLGKTVHDSNSSSGMINNSSRNTFTDLVSLATLPACFSELEDLDLTYLNIPSLQEFANVRDNVKINLRKNRICDFSCLTDSKKFNIQDQYIRFSEDFVQGWEYELPELLRRILDEDDLLAGTLSYRHCSLSEDGTKLVMDSNASYAYVTVEGGKLDSSEIYIKVKKIPRYTVPKNLTATVGDTLAEIALPDGFTWKDDSLSVGAEGTNLFKAVYTPRDTDEYVVVDDIDVLITVKEAETEPEDPPEPTDPPEPPEPTDPTEPPEPTDPTEPTDPIGPTEPVEPEDPPKEQTKPEDPPKGQTKPSKPIEIPEPAKPTEQEKEEQKKRELELNSNLKVKLSGKKIQISWGKVPGADGYDVYVQYCYKRFSAKSIIPVNNGGTTKITVSKVNGKKLDLKKFYKVYVRAYKWADNKKITLAKTITAHVVGTKNTEYTNVKEIKLGKSSFVLKKDKSATIKARTVLVSKDRKQLTDKHAKQFRYATTNKKVATVSGKGKIKAVGKGSCTIYVYARNGYAKKVKVKVK